MDLSEDQMRYGITHVKTIDPAQRRVNALSEYAGEKKLTINCTQLDFTPFSSAKDKKRVPREWCEFLAANPTAFTALRFGTRLSQALLDAVGHQRELRHLDIKWGAYEDLSGLAGCQALRVLHIGSGARVRGIEPLARLRGLVALSVENFQKITDYAPLAQLRQLQSLSIMAHLVNPPDIKPDSLEFLREMPQLRFFRLASARLQTKDYSPVLTLTKLEHLDLPPTPEVKTLHANLVRLPRLRWGNVIERPEWYRA